MTVITPPAWLQAGTYPARTDRLVMASLVATSGRVSPTDLVVTQSATPGMRVSVSAGRAWILGTTTVYQGAYNFVNDASVEVNIAASSAVNPRKDVVIARIHDSSIAGVDNKATLEIVTGTPAASPVTPSVPANSLILAVITVPANASSIVTANISTSMVQTASFFSQMKNDTIVCTSTTRPVGSERFVGASIFETDTLREWMWTGSVWSYRGGGPAPRAAISSSASMPWGNVTGNIYNLSPAAGQFETGYFTFVNGANNSSGDRIKVTQSGMYVIDVAVHADRVGSYYCQVEPFTSPGPASATLGATGASNAGGFCRIKNVNTMHLNAGQEVGVKVYMNYAGTVLVASWLRVTMLG